MNYISIIMVAEFIKHYKRLYMVKKFSGKFHFISSMEKTGIHQPVQWLKTASIKMCDDKV